MTDAKESTASPSLEPSDALTLGDFRRLTEGLPDDLVLRGTAECGAHWCEPTIYTDVAHEYDALNPGGHMSLVEDDSEGYVDRPCLVLDIDYMAPGGSERVEVWYGRCSNHIDDPHLKESTCSDDWHADEDGMVMAYV